MNKHGGPRSGAGAPPIYGEPMTRRQVMLDERTVEQLRKLGDGNLSAGVREAARLLRERKR